MCADHPAVRLRDKHRLFAGFEVQQSRGDLLGSRRIAKFADERSNGGGIAPRRNANRRAESNRLPHSHSIVPGGLDV